ncbi:7-cyano-7-deazaguanine synthase [Vibrio phage vB_VcorM_GR11A]|nr:7-cyano-7-deazaguanine synthase [Vibrio phage vB_VcorM_GR11A]
MNAVLFSGGIDSIVAGHLIHATGKLKMLILVNYGQAVFEEQQRIMEHYAHLWGCETRVLSVPYPEIMVRNGHDIKSFGVFHEGYKPKQGFTRDSLTEECDSLADHPDWFWLEGRNAAFLLQASIEAIYAGCNKLTFGIQLNDPELDVGTRVQGATRGADINPHFVKTMNELLFQSFSTPFVIDTPLMHMSKDQVVSLGRTFGEDYTNRISCEFYPPCGICSQCTDSQGALDNA